jgi:DNA-binding response OmpR family regulator
MTKSVYGPKLDMTETNIMTTGRLRILAIEPDATCREHLLSLLSEQVVADVVVAADEAKAAAAMRADLPDLILVSAILPLRAEAQIVAQLKEVDPDGMVPVLTIPPVTSRDDKSAAGRSLLERLGRKRRGRTLPFDPRALTGRIGETLTDVRQTKDVPRIRLASTTEAAIDLAVSAGSSEAERLSTALRLVPKAEAAAITLQRQRLNRARRLTHDDLPGRCTLTTPAGLIVRMLNVSATGVLFESPLKFVPETDLAMSLLGPQTKLDLQSRIVRSEVSSVTGLGVTYRTAASFNDKVELYSAFAARAIDDKAAPQALADLLVRVTTELFQNQNSDDARAAFAAGVRQMVPTCDVKLNDAPVQPADGGDSIYFTVPGARPAILQATFDPEHEPSREEFKLLKAVAAIAAVILEFESTTVRARTA